MKRIAIAGLAVLLAGCAAGHGGHAGGPSAACSGRHVLACDVSPAERKLDPETCRCVPASDVAAITGHAPFGRTRGFRTRFRR